MAEFKLKRGQKVYHIREFTSVVELARRKLIAPGDPIFVPSAGRWVFASAIHELRPLLDGVEQVGDDAEDLPLEFVEPLTTDAGLTVEVDADELEIEILGEDTFEPLGPPEDSRTSPGGGPVSPRQDLWSGPAVTDWHSGDSDPEDSMPSSGGASPRPPISFQDWVSARARSGVIEEPSEDLIPLITGADFPQTDASPGINWVRLGGLGIVLSLGFGVLFLYVKTTADLEFTSWVPERDRGGIEVSERPVGTLDHAAVDPETARMDLRLRELLPPRTTTFYSFDQAQDVLFSELLNLKIGVADVRMTPVDEERSKPARMVQADVEVRLKKVAMPAHEQSGLVGLVVGKYIHRGKLKVRYLVLRQEGQAPGVLVRRVTGRAVEDYFTGVANVRQFLLEVQAGTVLPGG